MLPRQNLAESAASRSLPARPRDRDHHPADFRRRSLVRVFLRVMVGWRSIGVDILLRPGNLDAFLLPPSSCLLVGAIPPSSASPHEAAVSRDVAHATRPDATAFPSRRAGRGRSSSDKYRLSIRHRDALSPADARSCEPIRGPGNLGGIDRERSPDRPTECRSKPPTERSDAWLVGGAVIAPGRSGIERRREIARGGSGPTGNGSSGRHRPGLPRLRSTTDGRGRGGYAAPADGDPVDDGRVGIGRPMHRLCCARPWDIDGSVVGPRSRSPRSGRVRCSFHVTPHRLQRRRRGIARRRSCPFRRRSPRPMRGCDRNPAPRRASHPTVAEKPPAVAGRNPRTTPLESGRAASHKTEWDRTI